ncbi:MAG: S8 family serine peptidase [Gemmatimonadaceae bacterium]|nr:S8 family serine peptidase [Gemmatimonadaceae bacterium]
MAWHVVAVKLNAVRKTVAKAIDTQDGTLNRLIESGKADAVFPAAGRGRAAVEKAQQARPSTRARQTAEPTLPLPDAYVIDVTTDAETRELLEQLGEDPTVDFAFVAPPRFVLTAHRGSGAQSTKGTGAQPSRWGVSAINLDKARQQAGFSDVCEVVVGIIDSGLDSSHPDLAGSKATYVPRSARSKDTSGHGTHVTGIVAAVPAGPLGMKGVCKPTLRVYQALDPYSPALYYRTLREALETCDIVNLSLGGPHDPVEEQIIARSLDTTVVVAAMGNEYEEGNETSYPAAIEGVIAVGAVDQNLRRGQFSNTGPHIALCAPGVEIWSTVPSYRAKLAAQVNYDTWDGTSMAAPFVTGVVALLLAKEPELVPSQVRNRLKTRYCLGQTQFCEEFGAGIIDAEATLR